MLAWAACWALGRNEKGNVVTWLVAGRTKRRDCWSIVLEYVVTDQEFGAHCTDYTVAGDLDVSLCERRSVFPAKSSGFLRTVSRTKAW